MLVSGRTRSEPHLEKTFKVSNYHSLPKTEDVVGLYLSPSEHAWYTVATEDAESRLDRTQKGLPIQPGVAVP